MTSWFLKFNECLVAAALFFVTAVLAIRLNLDFHLLRTSPVIFIAGMSAAIVWALGYSIYWQRKESTGAIDSASRHAWLRGLWRYWLALNIALYGFAKLFHQQFQVAVDWYDRPVGSLNGMELTWTFFGFSEGMTVVVALLQIGGAILLLFRRTTLLGVALLLPVFVNIVLIDFLYGIQGPGLLAIVITLELLFLLLLRLGDLKAVFLQTRSNLPEIGGSALRSLFRLGVVALAFVTVYVASRQHPLPVIAGKWKVDRLVRGTDTLRNDAWLTDTGAWKNIYVDYGVILCPNPYICEDQRSVTGDYSFDPSAWRLAISGGLPGHKRDSMIVWVSHFDGRHMDWTMRWGADTLQLALSRVKLEAR